VEGRADDDHGYVASMRACVVIIPLALMADYLHFSVILCFWRSVLVFYELRLYSQVIHISSLGSCDKKCRGR
jgi:hypothetical protein